MHVESVGQQKSDGKLPPHCCKPWTPPHVCAWRRKRVDAWVDVIAEVRRKRTDSMDSVEGFVEEVMMKTCACKDSPADVNGRWSGTRREQVNQRGAGTRPRTARQKEMRRNEQSRETKETIRVYLPRAHVRSSGITREPHAAVPTAPSDALVASQMAAQRGRKRAVRRRVDDRHAARAADMA